jgi:hypothetical protein
VSVYGNSLTFHLGLVRFIVVRVTQQTILGCVRHLHPSPTDLNFIVSGCQRVRSPHRIALGENLTGSVRHWAIPHEVSITCEQVLIVDDADSACSDKLLDAVVSPLWRPGAIPTQRVFAGRAVPVWQLRRMLYVAAAFTVAMAATRPESAHGDDAHPAGLLTIRNSGIGAV